jgi:hypothetical protein
MEDWMHVDRMIYDVFQKPLAYPYPFGSASLGQLAEMSDEALRRLPCRRPPKARQPRPPGAWWSYRRLGRRGVALPPATLATSTSWRR